MTEKTIELTRRKAVCRYRKLSGKGCKNCPFLRREDLCVQPPRQQPSTTLLENR